MENNLKMEFNLTENLENSVKNLVAVKKKDNSLRFNLLKEIENVIREQSSISEEDFLTVLEIVHKPLLLNLSNSSEKCKEISLKILQFILSRVVCVDNFLPVIVSTLVPLLGTSDEREMSEEIRLLEIQILIILLQKFDGNLIKYLSDIIHILSKSIVDECPEVKRKSCECVSILALKHKAYFHMNSGSLINPLLQTISHQHFKTRAICIRAIGSVIQYGSSEDLMKVITHLAQRLFDQSPSVRLAVVETVGDWLVNLDDRYSYFQRLIPLMLSALYDDVSDVQSTAKDLWCKAGDQYLEENEKDYKDLVAYPKPVPTDYPNAEQKPTLGCQLLVQRHFYNIISPLLNDIHDWAPDTRIKSAKVLYSLILHAEEKATIKLPSLIEAIVLSAKDEEQDVVSEAISSAELLGYFIEVKLLCDNILTLLHGSPTAVHLSILAAVMRGHKKSLPLECFTAICQILSNSSVCRLRKANEQANLLLCVDALFLSHDKINSETSYELFTILISVAGLTTNNLVTIKAKEMLDRLSTHQAISLAILYKTHSLTLLKVLSENSKLWTYQNPEMPIFSFLIQSGYIEDEEISFIIPILIENLKPTKEAKLRSHLLTINCQMIQGFSSVQSERLSSNMFNLVHDGVMPNLTWAAGKTAAALRTIAAASLYEVVNKNCLPRKMIGEIGDELLPYLATLSEDDIISNRLFSCKILSCIIPILPEFVDELKIHKSCHEFLQCMDDESDDVRIATANLFKTYFNSFSKGYNWNLYNAYLKQLFKNLLVHMDDKNENIRKIVLDMLKDAANIAPGILMEEINSSKHMMNSEDLCEELINYVKSLNINN